MKLQDTAILPGTPQQAWDLLTDPKRLSRFLPGAEKLEPDGPDRYKVSMKLGIAAFSGKFQGRVELLDKKPYESFRMKVEGRGAPGFMKGEGLITLRDKGGSTEVSYSGDTQVGGLIAAVGQRMIEATSKKMIRDFFDAAANELRRERQ